MLISSDFTQTYALEYLICFKIYTYSSTHVQLTI